MNCVNRGMNNPKSDTKTNLALHFPPAPLLYLLQRLLYE
jgi:hypothetical protein